MKAIDRLLIPLFHAPIEFFIFIISEYSNNGNCYKDKSYKFCDTLSFNISLGSCRITDISLSKVVMNI